MGLFWPGCVASPPASLLCEENMDGVFGGNDSEEELPELGSDLIIPGFPLESDEVVASLMAKEKEQLVNVATEHYIQRLNSGGLVSSWRTAAIDWINKAQAHHNFGPLCLYLSVNYLDRFLSNNEPPVDQPWMQQLLSVACLSIAAKMEETTMVPRFLDSHVSSDKYKFNIGAVQEVEIFVMSSLNWRMQAVTPFSYINYFVDKFTKGKPLSCGFASRCNELILSTQLEAKFLQFRPSEMAAAVVLSAADEAYVLDFSSALIASNIPVDKVNVMRCYEAMQEVGLVKKRQGGNGSPPLAKSPSGVLDASCLGMKTDDNQAAGSSQGNNGNNQLGHQACTPANETTRVDA